MGRSPRAPSGPPIRAWWVSPRATRRSRSTARTWSSTSAFPCGLPDVHLRAPDPERGAGPRVGAAPVALGVEGPLPRPRPHRGGPGNGTPDDRRPALPPIAGGAGADQHARQALGSAALRRAFGGAVSARSRGIAGLMARALAALAGREFDVLVVGGGITGAIAAWDAAQRGLSVALLERADFGGATSAESLKVVHGGVRYLQHLDIVRVRESSRERRALLRMAPHLVHPMPFVVPTYGHAMRGPEILGAAFLILNSLTADRNRGLTDPSRKVPRARDRLARASAGVVSRDRPGGSDRRRRVLRRSDVQSSPAGLGHDPDRGPGRRRGGQLLRRHGAVAPGRPGHRRAGGGPARRREVRGACPHRDQRRRSVRGSAAGALGRARRAERAVLAGHGAGAQAPVRERPGARPADQVSRSRARC